MYNVLYVTTKIVLLLKIVIKEQCILQRRMKKKFLV
jgi:hypothetical protein